jgi:hypothetical protein
MTKDKNELLSGTAAGKSRGRSSATPKRRGEVTVTRRTYPNLSDYYFVALDGAPVGTFEERHGGYVAQNRRKAVATIERAVYQLLHAKCNRLIGEAAKLARAMEDLPRTIDVDGGPIGSPEAVQPSDNKEQGSK